jgi:tetratricopeptide (TPR) repeat protein
LKLMGRPAGDRLTPEVAREVCQRTGSKAMLSGSITGLGSQYVIGLKAVNCDTGDVLAGAQEQATGKEALLKALDAAATSLRTKLGESLSSVQKYATPLQDATTPSVEALKAYSLGEKTLSTKGETAALPFYKRAVELLKAASTIELVFPTNLTISMCPVYLRGEAYLMLHDGNAAAAEFQKLIDHGLALNFPWGALARLGLARAYAMQGDTAKAKAAYQDFLTLWKDADPDIPIFITAKAEYAKLQ